MKIVHINTHMYGGAATVAKRIHMALLEMQIDSSLLTKYGTSKSRIPHHRFKQKANLQYFLKDKVLGSSLYPAVKFLQRLRPHPNLANKPPGYEIFSPLYEQEDAWHPHELAEADVIHLHWINNFINYSIFFKTYKSKRFVWTLHDMNPVTGGCHHSDGCRKYERDCDVCPQLKGTIDETYSAKVLRAKIQGLQQLSDDQLTIISPSKWLLDISQESAITRRFKHHHIPNPTFRPIPYAEENRESLRRTLRLSVAKKIVLFVADNLRNQRKGLNILWESLQYIKEINQIQFVGIGNGRSNSSRADIIFTGSITDPDVLAKYYSTADLFVIPSLAENSPLVVIEALSSGTPVVASNVGGIVDLINENNGITIPPGDAPKLAQAMRNALFERRFHREEIQTSSLEQHHSSHIASKYLEIYQTTIVPQSETH